MHDLLWHIFIWDVKRSSGFWQNQSAGEVRWIIRWSQWYADKFLSPPVCQPVVQCWWFSPTLGSTDISQSWNLVMTFIWSMRLVLVLYQLVLKLNLGGWKLFFFMGTHISFTLRCTLDNSHKQRASDSHHYFCMVVSQILGNWKTQCFCKANGLF